MSALHDVFPELLWIKDADLRAKAEATMTDGMAQGGWTADDMEKYAFSVNVLDISFRTHVRTITRMADMIYKEYSGQYAGKYALNYDHLIAGAILHDVGKFIELGKGQSSGAAITPVVYTEKHKYLGHPFIGAALALKHGLPYEIAHIIGYHSQEGELFPKSPEALVMTLVDHINFHPLRAQAAFA